MPATSNKIINWTFADLPRDVTHMIDNFREFVKFLDKVPEKDRIWKSGSELQKLFGKELRDNIFRQTQRTNIISDLDRVARGALAKCKFLGLFYVDEKNISHITDAGKELLTTRRPEDIILKQLIKWQYPDPLRGHHGANYPVNIFPLFITLKIMKEVKSLSKKEMALFLFTQTSYDSIHATAKNILIFKDAYAKKNGKGNKKKYFIRCQKMLFPKRKYKKKPNSLLDYADAYFRALIFTELFIVNNKGALEFNPKRMSEIDEILKEYEKRKIFDHENISKFYVDYYGRPSFYILPNENKTILSREIEELFKDLDNLLNANKGLPERFQKDFISLKSSPKIELSYRDELEDLKKDLNSILYCVANKNPVQFRRIIEYFNKIIQRDEEIYDPPAYLEWNTWRIFNALDDATKIIPNFRMGANLMPLSCAGGNRVDIELHYKTFAIGVEVTLTRGERQWIAEGYPVPRHIANLTDTASGLPVYGLFVAPTISSETKNVFFDAKTRGMFGKKLSIIPMDLDLFKKTIGVYENKSFEPDKFKDLLVSVGTNGINEEKWFDAIPQKVDNWLATF